MCIGDYITLKSIKWDSFLCCEGILNENAYLSGPDTNLDEELFCIHLQRQYSALRELDDFKKIYGEKISESDPTLIRFLNSLIVINISCTLSNRSMIFYVFVYFIIERKRKRNKT